MAKAAKKDKPGKVVVQDKDHPSLIEVGGKIRLRVLEDFYVERETPKWVRFRAEWDKFKKVIGFSFSDFTDVRELESRVKALKDKSEEEKAVLLKQGTNLLAMDKAMQDDRWHIREKHEREVDEAILKQAKFVRQLTVWDKAKNALKPRSRRAIPVEVAMVDLLDHIELTSTPELSARMEKLKELEDGMRKAGQYKKADIVKQLRTIVAEESVVIAAGFTNYVSEDTMIEFLRKSERGTMVDFLRYYDDEIPAEVIEKKVAADKLMVFDNYVVAHYSDLIHKAATVAEKVSAKEEKKQREKRRDPILFGLIKNSRKLYYICDWKTETDDLTLEKIEKELGVTRGSLVKGAETSTQASSFRTTGLDTERDEVNTNLGSTYGQMRSFIANLDDLETQRRFYEWDGGRLSSTASSRTL